MLAHHIRTHVRAYVRIYIGTHVCTCAHALVHKHTIVGTYVRTRPTACSCAHTELQSCRPTHNRLVCTCYTMVTAGVARVVGAGLLVHTSRDIRMYVCPRPSYTYVTPLSTLDHDSDVRTLVIWLVILFRLHTTRCGAGGSWHRNLCEDHSTYVPTPVTHLFR